MTFDSETTIKDVKNKLNESFIFVELDMNQCYIYKHGEQHVKSEPMVDYYKYTEPALLDADNKSLQYYNTHGDELPHLIVQFNLLLKVPCCRFSIIYIFTCTTIKHIQEKK